MHIMNPAILFLVFFIYLEKKIQKFFFYFILFYFILFFSIFFSYILQKHHYCIYREGSGRSDLDQQI